MCLFFLSEDIHSDSPWTPGWALPLAYCGEKSLFYFFNINRKYKAKQMWQCRLWGNQIALAELDLIFAISADLSSIPPVGVVWGQGLNGFIRVRCSIPACREWKNNFMELGKPGKNKIETRSARNDVLNTGEVIRKK